MLTIYSAVQWTHRPTCAVKQSERSPSFDVPERIGCLPIDENTWKKEHFATQEHFIDQPAQLTYSEEVYYKGNEQAVKNT